MAIKITYVACVIFLLNCAGLDQHLFEDEKTEAQRSKDLTKQQSLLTLELRLWDTDAVLPRLAHFLQMWQLKYTDT